MTEAEIEESAREFIASEPKARILLLGKLTPDDVKAVVRKTADLGYEPSINALKGQSN